MKAYEINLFLFTFCCFISSLCRKHVTILHYYYISKSISNIEINQYLQLKFIESFDQLGANFIEYYISNLF